MTTKFTEHFSGGGLGASLRTWGMISLTLIFVLVYGAAIMGWVKPLTDEKLISRLEPIIIVILGYYFGRLPAEQNENMLKEEIHRQTQRADAAQHAKEQAEQAREALEEKMKNIRAILASVHQSAALGSPDGSKERFREEVIRHSLVSAIDILNS